MNRDDWLDRMAGRPALVVATCLALFLAGAFVLSQVRLPHSDEGNFASCAWEFAQHGRLAFPMWTPWLPSLDRYMYTNMPLYFMQLGLWSYVSGYDLNLLRLNSVAWGLVFVLSWYFMLRGLISDRRIALLSLVLIAVNYDIMNFASGRYDVMAAALNAAGLACYAWWRERNLTWAVLLLAHCSIAAACMTHPYGLFGLIGFAVFFAALDLRRLSWRLVALAAVPYVVAFGAWGVYIAQAPGEFERQFASSASGRFAMLFHPVNAVLSEVRVRYLELFAGFRSDVPVYMRVKVLLLLVYLIGFAGCLLTPRIRRDRARMAVVAFGVVSALLLTIFEGTRLYIYLIHVLPVYSAVLAIFACDLMGRARVWRHAVLVGAALFCLYSVLTVAYRLRRNDYQRVYQPTVEFLAQNVKGDDLVMGAPECSTRVGFRRHFLDDPRLGYEIGLRPDYLVIDAMLSRGFVEYEKVEPAVSLHVQEVLSRAELIFERRQGPNFYRVYRVQNQSAVGP